MPESDRPLYALNASELETLASDMSDVEMYLRGFGRHVEAGQLGWQMIFEPLQGCPVLFAAAELAMAFGIWPPGQAVRTDWFHEAIMRPPHIGLEQRTHFARALHLIEAWRKWFFLPEGFEFRVEHFQLMCLALKTDWPFLNGLADLALVGARCEIQQGGSSLLGLLGCDDRQAPMAGLCEDLPLADPALSFEDFWAQLSAAMLLRPTSQMPWGFPTEAPHLMASVLPWAAVAPEDHKGQMLFLEFGVFNGSSINFIARSLRETAGRLNDSVPLVYGFDSFEGLPADWHKFRTGSFAVAREPDVEENVRLVRGWFNETLPAFLSGLGLAQPSLGSEAAKPWVRFVHLDCDLYSSALEVLRLLAPFFRAGSILIFDELVNYDQFEAGELRALHDFLREEPWLVRPLYTPWFVAQHSSELAELEASEGITELDLLHSAAFELVPKGSDSASPAQ
ncbi:unnamed protein product [Polarella glacialis]|uniref:Uncharacterized protein n=1 Tax=Polarella glacialis TaxID=89957 RepID=A0A813KGN5_POLGL|nr:unnamed protein product [Polarella glacialis]